MLTTAAQRAGFGGGVVVDYPNSAKKRKMYLCLMVGQSEIPKGLGENGMEVGNEAGGGDKVKNEKRRKERMKGKKAVKGAVDKEWILKKKDLYRTRGKEGVPRDSKVCSIELLIPPWQILIAALNVVYRQEEKAKVLDRRFLLPGGFCSACVGLYTSVTLFVCRRHVWNASMYRTLWILSSRAGHRQGSSRGDEASRGAP